MNIHDLRSKYRDKILEAAQICKVEEIKVFGSILRDDFTEKSDIDFLVKMKPNSGFAIGGLQWRLEEILGKRVDIVSEKSLHHLIKDQILNEAKNL